MKAQIQQLEALGFSNITKDVTTHNCQWSGRDYCWQTLCFGEYRLHTTNIEKIDIPNVSNWVLNKGEDRRLVISGRFNTILNFFKGDDNLKSELENIKFVVDNNFKTIPIRFNFEDMKAYIGYSNMSGYSDSRWCISKDKYGNYTLYKNSFAKFTEGGGGYWQGDEIILQSKTLSDLTNHINENGGTTI